MSLFVGDLAFDHAALFQVTKVGILSASVVSGMGDWLLLLRTAATLRTVEREWAPPD